MKQVLINFSVTIILAVVAAMAAAVLVAPFTVAWPNVNLLPLLVLYCIVIVRYGRFRSRNSALKTSFAGFGMSTPRTPVVALIGALALFVGMNLCVAIFHGPITLIDGWYSVNIFALILIIAAAAFEEVAFRGYLVGVFREKLGLGGAAVVSALLFALAHFQVGLAMIEYVSHFAFAITLTLLTWRCNSLVPAIVAHSVFNDGIGLKRLMFSAGDAGNHLGIFRFGDGNPNNTYLGFQTAALALLSLYLVIKRWRPIPNEI